MEQRYKDELNKLGFTSNVESVKTVLETRAYHNTCDDITDCSYAVLNMPTCHDAAVETKMRDILFKLFSECHLRTVEITHYSPLGGKPFSISRDSIQFTFSNALTEKELVDNVLYLLQMSFDAVREAYFKLSPDDPDLKTKKRKATMLGKRIKAIQIFIESGSTSYNYYTQHYHPLD